MSKEHKKRSIFTKFRNYFITGVVVLIPIGITVYLTLILITISSIPKSWSFKIQFSRSVVLPIFIKGLGIFEVIGIILFPKPAAKIIPFVNFI